MFKVNCSVGKDVLGRPEFVFGSWSSGRTVTVHLNLEGNKWVVAEESWEPSQYNPHSYVRVEYKVLEELVSLVDALNRARRSL